MIKNTIITIVIALGVSLGVVFFASPVSGSPDLNFAGYTHLSGLIVGTDGIITSSSTISVNGAGTITKRAVMTTATTTVCALQSPAATSTLVYGSAYLTVSSTSASTLTIAKATTAYATTTSLGASAIAANAQATIIASTTPTAGAATVFAPSTYMVVGLQGGTGTFSPTGVCTAVFRTVN